MVDLHDGRGLIASRFPAAIKGPKSSGPRPCLAVTRARRDQWTNLWGISQTASSTRSLTGGTTESSYDGPGGTPVVETYLISGMGRGLAVNPGSYTGQCGATGARSRCPIRGVLRYGSVSGAVIP